MLAMNALGAEYQLRERQIEQRAQFLAAPIVAQGRFEGGG
jgi:hypothetical protein